LISAIIARVVNSKTCFACGNHNGYGEK
jgi:hypothetical protein